MKICHVCFPLGKVGGIRTYMDELNIGLEELGHEVSEVFITTNTTKLPVKNTFGISDIFGFEKPEWIADLEVELKQYDMFIIHGVPHKTKAYQKTGWTEVFDLMEPEKCFFVIHDPYISKYYDWAIPIIKSKKIKCLCHSYKNVPSIDYLDVDYKVFLYPYQEKNIHLDLNKEDVIIDSNNFKGCKHKDNIWKHTKLLDKYEIHEFGSLDTFEGNQFKKQHASTPYNIMLHGWTVPEAIRDIIWQAKFGLDFLRISNIEEVMEYVILEYIDYLVMPITTLPLDKAYGFKQIYLEQDLDKELIYNKDSVLYNKKMLVNTTPKLIAEQIIEYSKQPYKAERQTGLFAF